jgi:hypothetical protein
MKIRIKGNTLRFRLTRSEVTTVARNGYLCEKTEFNGSTFYYAVKTLDDAKNLTADFNLDTITLYISTPEAQRWESTEQVGFEYNMKLENGSHLFLLLEKDFVCMDASTEDQSDNYPNPAALKKNE